MAAAVLDPLPVFTAADEAREKASLTPSEVIEAECDLRGLSSDNGESTPPSDLPSSFGGGSSGASLNEQLSQMLEELVALPGEEKAAYLRAVIRCPDQANDRSRQSDALRREEYDAKRAAKRIAKYWEERVLIFGDAKAYLPMTLHGALSDEVASMLEYRIDRFLANKDISGRIILCCDLARADSTTIKMDEEARHLWYVLECLSQEVSSRTTGVIIVVNCPDVSVSKITPSVALKRIRYVLGMFPFRIRAIHVVQPNECALQTVIPAVKYALGRKMRQRLVIHQGSDEEVTSSMAQFGLNRNDAKCEKETIFKSWIHQRLAKEYAESYIARQNAATHVDQGRSQAAISAKARKYKTKKMLMSIVGQATAPRGDSRMTRAVQARIRNPKISSYDALTAGGFVYPRPERGVSPMDVYDADNVSLQQRKNQLSRRIRQVRDAVATMNDGNSSI